METTLKTPTKKIESGLTKNIVQFRNCFVNLPNTCANNRAMAMSVMSELMQFGYILTQEAIDNISRAHSKDIIVFHKEVISYLKKMTGSNRNFKPFWSGFPQQVMEMSEFELWMHQITHYMSNGSYIPDEWTKERPTAFEQPKYQIIDSGNEEMFEKILTDLVSVNQSLTPDDLDIVKWFVLSESKISLPEQIPFKENLCTLASMGLDVPVKTVTDVLRIAVGMSGGDISLPKVPQAYVKNNRWSSIKTYNIARDSFKFKKFTRSERKRILSLLEKTNCDASEAVLKDQRWLRLGEILHPGEYKTKFPMAFKMFDAIRNHKVQSWYGKVDNAFAKSFEAGVELLAQKPGEFIRRMDWMVRFHEDKGKKTQPSVLQKYVHVNEKQNAANEKQNTVKNIKYRANIAIDKFKEIAPKISNKVLYEVYNHFENRYVGNEQRSIMVKGSRKRTVLPSLPSLDSSTIEAIQKTVVNTLIAKFSKLPKIGNVYVDEKLKDIPMPTNMRSASSGLRPRIRGQRVAIGNKNAKVIRSFVHWYDERGDQDLDLHGILIGDNKSAAIGWNGRGNTSYGCYSGDIRHRQGACAEYIDIDLKKALKAGFKYAIISVNNYNGNSFTTVKDCVAGYMEREKAEANDMFLPSTIANCTMLTNEKSTTLISLIDLESQEYIHLDIDIDGIPVASVRINDILEAIKPYCETPKFSVYDLILLHVQGRKGTMVGVEEKADEYFTFDKFSESYLETMKLMGV